MELDPIALSTATSAFMAFFAAFTLLYDWYATGKGAPPRLEWGIGMIAYGTGHFLIALFYSVIGLTDFHLFIFLLISGGLAMSLFLFGTLRLFDPNLNRAITVSSGFGIFFTIGTFLFGFVLSPSLTFTPVLVGEVTNRSMMSWFGVELLVPVSFLIAYLMFVDLRATQNIASFWISLHFFLYGVLLLLFPFDDNTLQFIFYFGRALSIAAILVGVRELGRKKVYLKLIRDAKAESQFLLDVLTHDIKGFLYGSQLLLDYKTIDNKSLTMIEDNLSRINTLIERVRRYKALDRFRETVFAPMNLVEVIEKNLKDVTQSFPQNSIDYVIHLDPKVEKFEIMGNEFLNDIFLNIFQNTVKHHQNKPEVYFNISIKEIEKSWKIAIEDDGPGIPSDQVDSLFTISTNKPSSAEKGLGQLIVRKTVTWYGGDVWAENRIIGDKIVGAIIHVTLPKFSQNIGKIEN